MSYQAGPRPGLLAIGDLNGDRVPDLVVAGQDNAELGSVSVLLGRGDGSFHAPVYYRAGFDPSAVAIGDLDGDGVADVAVAHSSPEEVAVLTGRGDGSLRAPVAIPVAYAPTSLTVADLDRDGRGELVAAVFGGVVSTSLSRTRRARPWRRIAAVGTMPWQVVVADLDRDGAPDLVVRDIDSNGGFWILLADGAAGFRTPVFHPIGMMPGGLAVGDLDGDGIPDIAISDGIAATKVSVLLGDGAGGFREGGSYVTSTKNGGPRDIAIGDLDGDGVLDIAFAYGGGNMPSLLRGDGGGSFGAPLRAYIGDVPTAVAIGDLNGDRRADLVATNMFGGADGNGAVVVRLGDGAAPRSHPPDPPPTPLPDPADPTVAIGSIATHLRHRAVMVRLRCRHTRVCRGTLALRARLGAPAAAARHRPRRAHRHGRRRHAVRIAHRRYRIHRGSHKLRLRIARHGRRALSRRGRLRVAMVVHVHSGPASRRAATVRAPR